MVTPNSLLDEEEADEVEAGIRGYDTDMICLTDEPYDELANVSSAFIGGSCGILPNLSVFTRP